MTSLQCIICMTSIHVLYDVITMFNVSILETTSTQINNWPEFPKHHIYLYFSHLILPTTSE